MGFVKMSSESAFFHSAVAQEHVYEGAKAAVAGSYAAVLISNVKTVWRVRARQMFPFLLASQDAQHQPAPQWAGIGVVLVLACFLAGNPRTSSAKDIEDVAPTYRFLLQGWRENYNLLRTGIVRFHGRKLEVLPNGERLEGLDEGFCAFDFTRGFLRFDRCGPTSTGKAVSERNGKTQGQKVYDAKWARTPEQSIQWVKGHDIASIYDRSKGPPSGLKWFDVRSLGFATWRDLTRGTPPDDIFGGYNLQEPTLIADEDGIYRIAWLSNGSRLLSTLWLDGRNGYTPIRMEMRQRSADGNKWLPPDFETTATWQRLSGVWVIKTFAVHDTTRNAKRESDLSFDWESVNSSVPSSCFTAKGFDLKTGDLIVDASSRKPIILERVGGRRTDAQVLPVTPRNNRTAVVVCLSITILILVAIFVFRRLRRYRTS